MEDAFIASISIGATREFRIKHKDCKTRCFAQEQATQKKKKVKNGEQLFFLAFRNFNNIFEGNSFIGSGTFGIPIRLQKRSRSHDFKRKQWGFSFNGWKNAKILFAQRYLSEIRFLFGILEFPKDIGIPGR